MARFAMCMLRHGCELWQWDGLFNLDLGLLSFVVDHGIVLGYRSEI
jgi:hypothetical protein